MQKTLLRNDGRKLEVVSKRVIWDLMKTDDFLRELATKCKPVKIQHNDKIWEK